MAVLDIKNLGHMVVNDILDLRDTIANTLGYEARDFINGAGNAESIEAKRVLEIRESEIQGYDIDVTGLKDISLS